MALKSSNETIDELKRMQESGKYDDLEKNLGKGHFIPFNTCNSGSRKQMEGTQLEQNIELYKPEVPRIQTGMENRFGDRSSSLIIADKEYLVIYKISKFSWDPDRFYYLIIYDPYENSFDMLTRKEYEHFTETYGILYNNEKMDSLKSGSKIKKGETVRKSLSYDQYNNRCDGVNLLATYMSIEHTKEDGIVISQSASEKLSSPLIKKISIVINDNDIPLNKFGRNPTDYKCFPDIGEDTEFSKGVLCAIRREKKEEQFFTQSRQNLSTIMNIDDVYEVDGTVVDIDVYANNTELLENSYFFSQIDFYNKEKIRFMKEFVDNVQPLIDSGRYCSYELKKTCSNFKTILNGGQYLKDNVFSNVMLELTVVERNPVKIGDKITNRYGGKGVVSDIRPDEMMPLLDNGQRVDVIYNSSTCINRENNGQLNEMFMNFVADRMRDHIYSIPGVDVNYAVNLYIDYLSLVNKDLAKAMEEYLNSGEPEDVEAFMSNMFDEGMIIPIRTINDNINIDKLAEIKRKFDFVKQFTLKVPQLCSDGNYRYVNARRTLECGEQYIWRLKQYAEEKFSVVSLGATNLKNETTRDNSKRTYKSKHSRTVIAMGNMETGNMLHLGVEPTITNMLLHSVAPIARRRLGTELLEGSIFDFDIKLPEDASNRTVEILNTYLNTIGLKLSFLKLPKKKLHPIVRVHPNDKLIKPLSYPTKLVSPLVYEENEENYVFVGTIGEETDRNNKREANLKKILHYVNE